MVNALFCEGGVVGRKIQWRDACFEVRSNHLNKDRARILTTSKMPISKLVPHTELSP
jgi:hypothetical protein